MTTTYKDKPVTVVRDAQAGDAGFDAAKTDQVLIRDADGKSHAVPRAEVTKAK
jgi:hypothetical protein